MRVNDADGAPRLLVILAAPDGTVHASIGKTAIALEPHEVSRIVQMYRSAQAVALQRRGRW